MISHSPARIAFVLAALASGAAWPADQPFRVLHHQAVQLSSRAEVGTAEHLSFNAYGRRFELSVSPNERVRRGMSVGNTRTMPLQGSVDGVSNSWVRITRSPSGWRGMIFDGTELYAIETAADVAGVTVEPLEVTGAASVVYRLSDALLPTDTMECEIGQPLYPETAEDAVEQIGHDFRAQAATLTAMKQAKIGVLGDYPFVNSFVGTTVTPEDAVIARMNIVDGIFTNQLGVKLSLAPLTLFTTPAADPFSNNTAASGLLNEVRNYRAGHDSQKILGVTHLMTGRNLDGDTVGIAYIGSVCQSGNADSLSEGRRSTTQAALIAAHEIGHNFNAPHDGDSAAACASTPQTFLMAPRLNGSNEFSACSVQQMRPTISSARCLTAYTPPDAGLEIATPAVQATVSTAFVASFVVRATGDDASNDVSVSAAIPAALTINSVQVNGGTCTTGAGTATCTLGNMAAGDARQVDMNLTSTEAGSLTVDLALNSDNDSTAANNTAAFSITSTATPVVVTPPPPPPTPTPPVTGEPNTGAANGGGGGGRVDLLLLAMLGTTLLAGVRRRVIIRGDRA